MSFRAEWAVVLPADSPRALDTSLVWPACVSSYLCLLLRTFRRGLVYRTRVYSVTVTVTLRGGWAGLEPIPDSRG